MDVYDPTTGQIRSASTDDIACWFIDTDCNGEFGSDQVGRERPRGREGLRRCPPPLRPQVVRALAEESAL